VIKTRQLLSEREGNVCKKELFYYKIFTVDALGTYFNEDQYLFQATRHI
jgi:hypothetical protein